MICRQLELKKEFFSENLFEKSQTATFFQTYDWLSLWQKHFGGENLILGIFDNDDLVGLAPFSLKQKSISFLGVTPVLGQELVSDFGDIICETGKEKEIWPTILSFLKTNFPDYKIELNFLREDSPSLPVLQALIQKIEEVETAPEIILPDSWENYLRLLSRHNRHELRRKLRKSEKEKAEIYQATRTSDVEEFFRLMTLSSQKKSDFLSLEMKNYFRDLIEVFLPQNLGGLYFLKIDGINAAGVMFFLFQNDVLLYNAGFDPKYNHLSPGLVLTALVIKKAIAGKKTKFDFLRGHEPYKYALGAKDKKLYKVTMSSPT